MQLYILILQERYHLFLKFLMTKWFLHLMEDYFRDKVKKIFLTKSFIIWLNF